MRPLGTIFILLLSYSDVVVAQARKPAEYEVKAAYLYNFGKFVRWPASVSPASTGAFLICVLGKNPFGSSLDETVRGESIDGKSLSVHYLSNLSEISGCRILFISSSEEHRLDSVLADVGKRPMLTVSDMADFVNHGGDIELVQVGGKIRFKVNLASAEKRGLALSSDLLKVAVSVKRDDHSGD